MRKRLALLLALAVVLGLASCGKKDDKENNSAAPEDQVQMPEPQPDPQPDSKPLLPDPEKDELGDGEEILEDNGEESQETGGEEESGSAPAFRISHEDVTLGYAGETFRLTVWDANGDAPDTCTYTSTYPEVAAVDETGGAVTAMTPGNTTITAHAVYGNEQLEFQCIVRCKWTEEEKSGTEKEEAAGGTESCQPDSPASRPALADFVATLQGSYEGLGALSPFEGEVLENYYPGLSGIAAVEEILVQETMMSTANVAVGLVKLSDDAAAEDIQAVEAIFQARIKTQAEGGAWYPASCETWENGVITSASNCVGMFVYPENAQELADLFTEAFTD